MARVPPQQTTVPVPPSPIDYFRSLIVATPVEREKLLVGKSPESCRVLTNSIHAYLALSPGDRELRLRSLGLRYYLTPLLRLPATNRTQNIERIPEAFREIIRERLAAWDKLPAPEQKKLLEAGQASRVASVMTPPLPPTPTGTSVGASISPSADMKAIAEWRLYSESKKQEIVARFERFSDMPEPKKALEQLPLSPTEREQIEKSLEKLRTLPPTQRGLVLSSFKKFADLPIEERRQFLRNAESWKAMSPEERDRWRQLVNNLPPLPPFPPGFGGPGAPPALPVPGASVRGANQSSLIAGTNAVGQ